MCRFIGGSCDFMVCLSRPGVLVVSVEKKSPAERAGSARGRLDCCASMVSPIGNVHDLHKVLVGEQIGVSARLTVIRHTEKLELPILPAESRVINRLLYRQALPLAVLV